MEPEIDDMLKRLALGWGIVSHPRSKVPFLISTTLIALPRITDEQLRAHMTPFWKRYPATPTVRVESVDSSASEGLPAEQMQFLMEVANHPSKSTTEYYRSLGWPASKGTRVKKRLESNQVIKCLEIKLARRGGGAEAIELLPLAFDRLGLAPLKLPGKGGFLHAWWIGRIALALAAKKPVIEKVLNGKAADIAIETENGWHAWEVQRDCREELVRDLLSKDISAGFLRVILCVETKEDARRVKEFVAALGFREKVDVKLLAEFYTQGGSNEDHG